MLTGKYQLRTPLIKAPKRLAVRYPRVPPMPQRSDYWVDYFEATGNYLQKNYVIQGINGILPALSITISTFERGLDFKRIVQALVHFNQLWPKVFSGENRSPDSTKPRVIVQNSYISHHPDHWSAIPTTGEIFLFFGQASEVGKRSVLWTQFAINLIVAATESPSLEFIQSYPITVTGLNAFMLQSSV